MRPYTCACLRRKENGSGDEGMLVIRDMEAADVEAASVIEREAFTMPWSAGDFLEMVEADYASYYVAELDGDLVHIDTTWGDTGTQPNYAYFAMSPEESWREHSW